MLADRLDRVAYEVRLAWKPLILAPLAVLALVAPVVLLDRLRGQSPAHILLAGVEMLLPTVAGIITASMLASDDALELQLTTPRPYRRTALLRLALISGWMACLAALGLGGIALFRQLDVPAFAISWPIALRIVVVQGVWFAPLCWLVAVGFLVAALMRSRTASGAVLGGLWLIDIVFVGTIAQTTWLRPLLLFPASLLLFPATHISREAFTRYWLDTRVALVATALVVLPIAWLLLRNSERLLKGVTAE